MLRNISPLLSPKLLYALRAMRHGDEIAVVLMGEGRLYGNILLTKGVIPL